MTVLLMDLREFPGDANPAGRGNGSEILQAVHKTVRGFKIDTRHGESCSLSQLPSPSGTRGWKKPAKNEGNGRKAATHKSCHDSAGSWQYSVLDRLRNTGSDESESGIADGGSPSISHQCKLLARTHACDEFRKAALLIMLMEADQRLANLQVR